jgi:DnaD/phage-associated family protein
MAIFRVRKTKDNPYIMINKFGIYDNRLSYKAKGILVYLLSRPDNWIFYEDEIVSHSSDGKDSVRSGIKELINYGYITRQKKREAGKFAGYEYIVYEAPVDIVGEDEEAIYVEKDFIPHTEKPFTENPKTVNPKTEKPKTEKPKLLNNDITNKRNELNNEVLNNDVVVVDKQQQEFQKIVNVFNNNIHLITAIEAEKIMQWLEELDADVIIMAIEEAVTSNKRNFKYINAVLNSWFNQGLKTKTDVEAYLREWQKQKGEKTNGLRNGSKEDTGGIKLKIPTREYRDYTEEELRRAGLI